MELVLAKSQDALVLTSISKRAFDSDVITFTLDTPLWNIRTNNFYQKLGYKLDIK